MASDFLDLTSEWQEVDTVKSLDPLIKYSLQNTNNGKPLTRSSFDDALAYLMTATAPPATPEEHRAALKSCRILTPAGLPFRYTFKEGEKLYAIAPQGPTSISIEPKS